LAAEKGHLPIVELLVNNGADVGAQGEIDARLYFLGTDLFLLDDPDGTALHFAAWKGRFDVVKSLTRSGAKLDAKSERNTKYRPPRADIRILR
jgi:ankyrin repeat protein